MIGRTTCFREELETFSPGIVSLIGGGGKTSLLFALGKALAAAGRKTVCTTTTRMLRPEPSAWLTVAIGGDPRFPALPARGALFAARPPREGESAEKVAGYAAEEIDRLREREKTAWILVEADGSAGRPLKAPAAHEPAIPSKTDVAIAVVGLGGMLQPVSEKTVFRMERFSAVTGLAEGDGITGKAMARLAPHPGGLFKNVPPGAKRLLFCNQTDLPGAEKSGVELAGELLASCPGFLHGVFLGSLREKGLQCLSFPTR